MNGLNEGCGLSDGDYKACFMGPRFFSLRHMRVDKGVVFFRGRGFLFFPGRWDLSPIQNFSGLLKDYQTRLFYDFDGPSKETIFFFPFDLDSLSKYCALLPVEDLAHRDSLLVERDLLHSRASDLTSSLMDLNNEDLLHKRMSKNMKYLRSLAGSGPKPDSGTVGKGGVKK